jgi:hypothetical protein
MGNNMQILVPMLQNKFYTMFTKSSILTSKFDEKLGQVSTLLPF